MWRAIEADAHAWVAEYGALTELLLSCSAVDDAVVMVLPATTVTTSETVFF